MKEMEPWEEEIDGLLRRSMASAAPELSPNFERNLISQLDQASEQLDKYRRLLITGYVLVSVVACVVIMRGEGLDWPAIGALVLGALALVAVVPSMVRLTRAPTHGALP
jgi:hypothetical protein